MISLYKMKSLRDEELFDAIALMEKEYNKTERNTPTKMARLISSNFDVACDPGTVVKFFVINEDFEKESLKIEIYDNMRYM